MKQIMAGGPVIPCADHGEGYTSCKCYTSYNGEYLGSACCSPEISYQDCCNAQYQGQGTTTYVDCT